MQRHLQIILFIVCLLLSIAVPFIHPEGTLALSDQEIKKLGYKACNDAFIVDSQNPPFCSDGYIAGYKGQSPPRGCPGGNLPCGIGYKLGVEATKGRSTGNGKTKPPSKVPPDVAKKANDYCSNQYGLVPGNCPAGYMWAYINGQKPSPCDGFCSNGYSQGLTDRLLTMPSQCQSWAKATNSFLDSLACEKGVKAKLNNQSNPCGKLSDTKEEKTACEAGFSNTTTSSPGGAGGTADKSLTCDGSNSPLGWAICPVTDLLVTMVEKIDNMITDELYIQPNQIFCSNSDNCKAYYTAWQGFRNIALGLMVIAGLIVVISQALGLELLDAYMIRKTLPRLLVAALAITLSWPLMQFAIILSNDLGVGVRQLIQGPFEKLPATVSLSSGGGLVAILLQFSAVAIVGLMGILSLFATAALAVFVAIIVLILRQVVIIGMIILAPIAIVAYILPNTQRVYKLWWESFSKALLMFPLIAAFIASGRVFAAIAVNNSGGGGRGSNLNQLIGIGAYFAPYFMLPATFKLAGGALSAMGGLAHNASRPVSGMLGKYRSNESAKNMKRIRGGQRWNQDFGRFGKKPGMSIGHLANRAAVNLFDQDELLPYRLGKERSSIAGIPLGRTFGGIPGFKRGSAHLQDQLDNRAISESQKAYQAIEQNGGMHYQGYRALAGNYGRITGRSTQDGKLIQQKLEDAGFINPETGESRAPSSLGDIETIANIMQESDNDKDVLGGEHLLHHSGTLASIKSDPEMSYADTQVIGSLGAAAAGRADDLADITNSIGKRLPKGVAQRSMKASQTLASRTERPDQRDGHGFIFNSRTGLYESAYSDTNYRSRTAIDSVKSAKDSGWTNAKAEAIQAAHRSLAYAARGGRSIDRDGHDVETRTAQEIANDAQGIREAIQHGITSPHNDAGQRSAWRALAPDAGFTPDELARMVPRDPTNDPQTTPEPESTPET